MSCEQCVHVYCDEHMVNLNLLINKCRHWLALKLNPFFILGPSVIELDTTLSQLLQPIKIFDGVCSSVVTVYITECFYISDGYQTKYRSHFQGKKNSSKLRYQLIFCYIMLIIFISFNCQHTCT